MIVYDKQLDSDLVLRLKERDPQALADIYDRYGRMLYSLIYRMVRDRGAAEDLTQETMLRIWNGVHGFDPSRASLSTWMTRVARNRSIDYLRSRAARESFSIEIDNVLTVSADFDEKLDARYRMDLIRKRFRMLTADEKLVLRLSYFGGLTQREISRQINRPLGTVKTWVRTALTTLRTEASCPSPAE